MTINQLYLGDAFGWDTESTAMVAISQLREKRIISVEKCPKAQLIKNGSLRWEPNLVKILGYIPGFNFLAGIAAMTQASSSGHTEFGPDHTAKWRGRGIAMLLTGPLLIIADLLVFLYNCTIVKKYQEAHPDLIAAFDTPHGHTGVPYPGHPVFCKINNSF